MDCSSFLGKTPMMRSTVFDASMVWSVESTRWPVSAASSATSMVSRSRISPTRMTFGACRSAARSAQREARRVRVQLPLVDGRFLVRVEELDGVFDGDDVVSLRLVDEVDDGGQRRGLARARRARHQHDAVLQVGDLLQDGRQVEVRPLRRRVGDDAHDDGVRAALHEDVDAEAREARGTEREVGRAELLKVLAGRLVVADDDLGERGGVRRQELLQPGDGDGLQLAEQLDLRRAPRREDQVAHLV